MMELLTSQELMGALKISRSTLHRLKRRGLPTVGSGKLIRYDPAQTMEWFRNHAHQPNTSATMLAPGDYRCGHCGFEGTLLKALYRARAGPCPKCGGQDITYE